MRTGSLISAAAHSALVLAALFGGTGTPEGRAIEIETADVSILSEAEFAAMTSFNGEPVTDVEPVQVADIGGAAEIEFTGLTAPLAWNDTPKEEAVIANPAAQISSTENGPKIDLPGIPDLPGQSEVAPSANVELQFDVAPPEIASPAIPKIQPQSQDPINVAAAVGEQPLPSKSDARGQLPVVSSPPVQSDVGSFATVVLESDTPPLDTTIANLEKLEADWSPLDTAAVNISEVKIPSELESDSATLPTVIPQPPVENDVEEEKDIETETANASELTVLRPVKRPEGTGEARELEMEPDVELTDQTDKAEVADNKSVEATNQEIDIKEAIAQRAESEETAPDVGGLIQKIQTANLIEEVSDAANQATGPGVGSGERAIAERLGRLVKDRVGKCWNVGLLSNEAKEVTVFVRVDFDNEGKAIKDSIHLARSSHGKGDATDDAFHAARHAIIRCLSAENALPVKEYGEISSVEIEFDPILMGRI